MNFLEFPLKRISIFLFCLSLWAGSLTAQTKEIPIDQDSLNQLEIRKQRIFNLFFSGLLFQNKKKNQVWYIPSLFNIFPPNTVEGFVFNPQVSFTQHFQNGKFYTLKPGLRYGFGNRRLQAKVSGQYYYAPPQKAFLQISGGRFVEQFNENSSLTNFSNTISTYLQNENFLKIYERTYLEVGHSISPMKDFLLTTTFSWNNRNPLKNLPKHIKEDSEFTSNTPINNELLNTDFEKHQALLWNVQLRWQVGHQLIRRRGELKSAGKYPALMISYSGSISGILGSDLAYQKIAVRVSDNYKAGNWGSGQFLLETGDFISKKNLSFVDFKHFNGQRVVYGDFKIGNFHLLDYYQNSTTNFYLQAHHEHQFNAFPIRRRNSEIQPVVNINYLYMPKEDSYLELGLGFKQVFKIWRIGFYNSWQGSKHESFGVRLGVVIE